jgi:hypothetical protein
MQHVRNSHPVTAHLNIYNPETHVVDGVTVMPHGRVDLPPGFKVTDESRALYGSKLMVIDTTPPKSSVDDQE